MTREDDGQVVPIRGGARVREALAANVIAGAGREVVCDTAPMRLAELFRERHHRQGETDTLVRYAGEWWEWQGGTYRVVSEESLVAGLRAFLDGLDTSNAEGERRPLKVTTHRVSETRHGLLDRRRPMVRDGAELPFALPGYMGPPPRRCVVVGNGLLNLDSGELTPTNPRLFATTRSDASYHAEATCPRWDKFLASVFAGDDESIRLLRQWFGYFLVGDASRQKLLLLFGPPRSGKGTISKVLTAILGAGSVANPTLSMLGDQFGMATLIGKTAAIIQDARLSPRTDIGALTERLLSISGEDSLTIDRKHRAPVEVRLRARVALLSNELPAFNDASGALAARCSILETRRTFLGAEDRGLEADLLAELPGILNWAIDGWRDLEGAGTFIDPARSASARADLEAMSSPIKAFLAEHCEVAHEGEVEVARFYARWKAWCDEQGSKPGTTQILSRNLRASGLVPALGETRPLRNGKRVRCLTGLRLRDEC